MEFKGKKGKIFETYSIKQDLNVNINWYLIKSKIKSLKLNPNIKSKKFSKKKIKIK